MGCGLSTPGSRKRHFDETQREGSRGGEPMTVHPYSSVNLRPGVKSSVPSTKSSVSSGKQSTGGIRKSDISRPIYIDWTESDFASDSGTIRSNRQTMTTMTTMTTSTYSARSTIPSMSSVSSFDDTPIKFDLKGIRLLWSLTYRGIEIVVDPQPVAPPRPQLVTVKKADLKRTLTSPEQKPAQVAPVPNRALSDPDLYKDTDFSTFTEPQATPRKGPKDLPKLHSVMPRLPSIDEGAFEPFTSSLLVSVLSTPRTSVTLTESPTSEPESKTSRLSVTTVATSNYSDDDDDEKRNQFVDLPLQFHPEPGPAKPSIEQTIVCGLPCADSHRAQELQYTLDVLTGSRARKVDEDAWKLEEKIKEKKFAGGAVKPTVGKQPVKPSGLVAKFAGAKERKKMEMQLLKRFEGKKGNAAPPQEQRPRRKIL